MTDDFWEAVITALRRGVEINGAAFPDRLRYPVTRAFQ